MASSSLRLTKVRPKDLSHEEVQRLFAARELNMGKPTEFATLLSNVWEGKWSLWTLDGSITGVMVLNPEGKRLNIYYLHGDGLFGKIDALAKRLKDISKKGGFSGLSCVTRDPRAARLFKMTPGARCERRGAWYFLEVDNGR